MLNAKIVIAITSILIITFFVFLPSTNNGFVNWDDDNNVIKNPLIKKISCDNIKQIFSTFFVSHYLPLTILSYSVEFYFFKENPRVYHITNNFLHMINTFLVFFLISLIAGNTVTPFICALLFGIHPLHVESVAWISERKDVLYSLFFLTSLILYIIYIKKNNMWLYCFSLFACLLSMLSKTMAVTLPFVLFLFDYILDRGFKKKFIFEKIPYILLSVLFVILALFSQNTAMRHDLLHPFPDNFFIGTYGLLFYIYKTFFPINLSCLYPYPQMSGGKPPFEFIISPVILLFLIAGLSSLFRNKYKRVFIFGFLFYVLTILPVLQILPVGEAFAADRYMYIPSIGIFYLISEGSCSLYALKFRNNKTIKNVLLIGIVCITFILSYLTYERNLIWQNSITLWSDVIKKYPSSWVAYVNRGSAYLQEKKYDLAMSDLNYSKSLNPYYAGTYYNLCTVNAELKKNDIALDNCLKAIELKPDYADAYNNAGNIFVSTKKNEMAIKMYKKALQFNPDLSSAHNNLAVIYYYTNNHDQSMFHFKRAVELGHKPHPDFKNILDKLLIQKHSQLLRPEEVT
jgi:protein O-mannosyl-transferase